MDIFFLYKVKSINHRNKNIDIYLSTILCIVPVFVKIINKTKAMKSFIYSNVFTVKKKNENHMGQRYTIVKINTCKLAISQRHTPKKTQL